MIDPADQCLVVPTDGESPHLDACLRSLVQQAIKTRTLIATSTPNHHVHKLADRHGVPIHVNPHHGGIGSDWNFALTLVETPWVTLANQDDLTASTGFSVVASRYFPGNLRVLGKLFPHQELPVSFGPEARRLPHSTPASRP